MPSTDVLKQFGLSRNPFTDRTAEKTFHDGSSLYVHSDLQGFRPSGAVVGAVKAGNLYERPGHNVLMLQKLRTFSLGSEAPARPPSECRQAIFGAIGKLAWCSCCLPALLRSLHLPSRSATCAQLFDAAQQPPHVSQYCMRTSCDDADARRV